MNSRLVSRMMMFTTVLPFALGSGRSVSPGAAQSMKLIPAQTFIMGAPSDSGRTDAVPAHPVTLDAYYMSPFLVTVQDYCNFLNESGWVEVKNSCGIYLVVVHTYNEINDDVARIRIISARKATKREKLQYQGE